VPNEGSWRRRTLPRTTCDQCKHAYADAPAHCVTVLVDHPLAGETICLRCATTIGITGCTYLHWSGKSWPIPYVLGTAPLPAGWPDAKPTAEEILRALSSSGYQRAPVPEPPTRLEFELSDL
jgi:hypothetical protein